MTPSASTPIPEPDFTLVALHGNGGGGFRFARTAPYFPERVHFVAPTLPGFAGEPPDPRLNTLTDYAHHLHTLIAAEERPLVLLGTGIGGSIALEYAQHYAARLDGLILHAPVGTRLDERFFPRLMRLPGMAKLGQWVFSSTLTRGLFRSRMFHYPVPEEYLQQFFAEYRRCSVFVQMFHIINSEWFDSLQPVKVPAALLWGELEQVLSVDQLDDYRRLLPQHVIRRVPDWDHFPMIEQPEQFAREVMALSGRLFLMDRKAAA